MSCPYCHSDSTRVVDKRDNKESNVTRRRRECIGCKKRFTTYERIETVCLNVLKRSGKVEDFDREKLKRGIMKAVKKRQLDEKIIDELIEDIELKLLKKKSVEIKAQDIGNMVLRRLKKIDEIGYILFASVYKDYNQLQDFENAITEIKESRHAK